MMYFSYLVSSNQTSNRLQHDARDLFQRHSNLLINNPEAFLDSLKREIVSLNVKHYRCKPLQFSIYGQYDPEDSIGVNLGLNYGLQFKLYPVKNSKSQEVSE